MRITNTRFSSTVSGGLSRAVNYETENLAPDVKWFMQYSGFGETKSCRCTLKRALTGHGKSA